VGLYFDLEARHRPCAPFVCVNFIENQGHQDLVYSVRNWEILPSVLGNRAEVGQNHDAQSPVSATLSVLKWGGAIFRTRSSKLRVQNFLVCIFHYKPRPSGVSLESLGLENIPQVPWNRAEVCQNHDVGKTVSATLWVLKCSWAIFGPRSLRVSVQTLSLCSFHCKPRPPGVSLESSGLKNTLEFREIEPKCVKITLRAKASRLLFQF